MYTILPVYKKEMQFVYCELCENRLSKTINKQNLLYHYSNHKRDNALDLERIRDPEIRNYLNLSRLENYKLLKCEIPNCNENSYSEEYYLIHVIEYHNSPEIIKFIKNEKIMNILSNRNLLNLNCELCQEEIISTRESYINHIKSKHTNELNYEIMLKVKDIGVLEEILKLIPENKKTKLKEIKNGLIDDLSLNDDYLNQIYFYKQNESNNEKASCDLGICLNANFDNYIEDYLIHFFPLHYLRGVGRKYNQIETLFKTAGYIDFRCEICELHLGDYNFNYINHIFKTHSDNFIELIYLINDLFVFTFALRKIIVNNRIGDSCNVFLNNNNNDNRNNGRNEINFIYNNESEIGYSLQETKNTTNFDNNNIISNYDNNSYSNNNSNLSYENNFKKMINSETEIDYKLKEAKLEFNQLKELNDSMFDEKLEDLKLEISELEKLNIKSDYDINSYENINEININNNNQFSLNHNIDLISDNNFIILNSKEIPKSSNEFRLISINCKDIKTEFNLIRIFILNNIDESHNKNYDNLKQNDIEFTEELLFLEYDRKYNEQNDELNSLIKVGINKGILLTRNKNKLICSSNSNKIIMCLVLIKSKEFNKNKEEYLITDKTQINPIYIIEY